MMLCDKLKAEPMIINDDYTALYYPKESVDSAIDELKREHHNERDEYIEMVARIKAENDRLKKKMDDYNLMSDIRRAKIKELKRALYKACANWARSERYTEATWHGDEHREELWANVQAKCLKKAEEYK